MTRTDPVRRGPNSSFGLRIVLESLVPAVQEAAKTIALLALLIVTVWGLLEIFREHSVPSPWYTRLWRTFADARLDNNGMPIGPRFLPAAARSAIMVLIAALLLGAGSIALGFLYAVRPGVSVLRPYVGLISAVPAFMPAFLMYQLGMVGDLTWLWPGVCLAVGDLNLAALSSHCYDGIRHELSQMYIRTARAQGLPVWSDVWPRAVLVTLEGLRARIPHLLGGTVALELAFNIHGVGQMALSSVLASRPDYSVLIWIAGLGIIATRCMSLLHRIARQILTPERGRTSIWLQRGSLAGVGVWRPQTDSIESRRGAESHDLQWQSTTAANIATLVPRRASRALGRFQAYWNFGLANRLKVSVAVVVLVLAVSFLAVVAMGGRYSMLDTAAPMQPMSRAHWMGTNESGEDVLSAIALGGLELVVPLVVAVATATTLGGFFGTIAGLRLGSVSDAAMDLYSELWESIPKLIIVLAAITFISYTHYSLKLFFVMGLAFAPLVFRAVRDEVGALRNSLFLEAAATLGVPRRRIFWAHVVRNHTVPVLCVEGAVLVGYLMLYDAILGYCQVRQRGEVFTWGSLLGTGMEDFTKRWEAGIDRNPMVICGPFAAMLLAIASSMVTGDALRSIGRSVRFNR